MVWLIYEMVNVYVVSVFVVSILVVFGLWFMQCFCGHYFCDQCFCGQCFCDQCFCVQCFCDQCFCVQCFFMVTRLCTHCIKQRETKAVVVYRCLNSEM